MQKIDGFIDLKLRGKNRMKMWKQNGDLKCMSDMCTKECPRFNLCEEVGLSERQKDEMSYMLQKLSTEGYMTHFGVIGLRTTYCWIKSLVDGWERVGLAYTKDPNSFDYNVGRYWALKEAFSQRADRTEK